MINFVDFQERPSGICLSLLSLFGDGDDGILLDAQYQALSDLGPNYHALASSKTCPLILCGWVVSGDNHRAVRCHGLHVQLESSPEIDWGTMGGARLKMACLHTRLERGPPCDNSYPAPTMHAQLKQLYNHLLLSILFS